MYDSRNCNLYYLTLSNCRIRERLTVVKNNRGYLEVINNTNNDIIFSVDRPINAEVYNIEQNDNLPLTDRSRKVLSRLRTQHLNPEEIANLENVCAQYADVFYLEGEPLTFTNKVKHRIRTTDEIPVHTKSYRYPYIHRQEVREQIQKMLDQNIIRPSESAWSSPIWIVPKKADASGKRNGVLSSILGK